MIISVVINITFVPGLTNVSLVTELSIFYGLVILISIILLNYWIKIQLERLATNPINYLTDTPPETTEIVTDDGDIKKVSINKLSEDDLIVVRPGARIPADGVIEEHKSEINESMVGGSSNPVSKALGDEVIAGTINENNSLRIRVNATGDETRLAETIQLVEEAQQIPC